MAFDDISIKTIIGASSAFIGNLRVNGAMMVDGDVDGNIEASGNIIIGEKARVRGNITAKSATISGIVIGDITAPDIVNLTSSATVIGDIATHRAQIASGVLFHGHCIALVDQETYEKEVEKRLEVQEIRSKAILR